MNVNEELGSGIPLVLMSGIFWRQDSIVVKLMALQLMAALLLPNCEM